jgi:monoterpene epsilon-lactone hydrolase
MASAEHYKIAEEFRSFPYRPDATLKEIRDNFEALAKRRFQPPTGLTFSPVVADGVPAEWVVPAGEVGDRIILYIHGGGFCMGSLDTHRGLTARLALAARARALSVDYRLAPEHPFPAAVDDVVTAYRWLLKQGHRGDQIVLAGDSAGGGIALSTLVALRDAGVAMAAAAVCMSPVTDLAKEGESMRTRAHLDPMVRPESSKANADRYIGDRDHKTPLASPLYADLRGLPPTLILVGTWEVLMDDSIRWAERAKAAGSPVDLEVWEEMMHVWPLFGDALPEAMRALETMGRYIKEKTPQRAAASR